MPLFIKKPEVVEAVRWLGEVGTPACIRRSFIPLPDPNFAVVDGISGVHIIRPGDWVVMRPNGDNYPVREELFHEIYVPAVSAGFLDTHGVEEKGGNGAPNEDAPDDSAEKEPADGDEGKTATEGAPQGLLGKALALIK